MKKTSLSAPYRNKIDVALTACLYCWLIWISRIRLKIQMSVFYVLRVFVVIFFPKKYLNRFYRKHIESMKAQDILFGNMEYGDDIMTAKNMVFFTCIGFIALPVSFVSCTICSLIGWDPVMDWMMYGSGMILPILLTLLTIFGVSMLTKTSCDPHFYLPYFKKFKKRDGKWLKRWKRYTILLFLGSFLSVALSIGLLFLCLFIHRNIHEPFNY